MMDAREPEVGDAFTVAAQLLGGLELDPGQLAQLRALDRRYQQRLYTLVQASSAPAGSAASSAEAETTGVAREPAAAELAELRVTLTADIRSLLSPRQRDLLERTTLRPGKGLDDGVLAWEWEGGGLG